MYADQEKEAKNSENMKDVDVDQKYVVMEEILLAIVI